MKDRMLAVINGGIFMALWAALCWGIVFLVGAHIPAIIWRVGAMMDISAGELLHLLSALIFLQGLVLSIRRALRSQALDSYMSASLRDSSLHQGPRDIPIFWLFAVAQFLPDLASDCLLTAFSTGSSSKPSRSSRSPAIRRCCSSG